MVLAPLVSDGAGRVSDMETGRGAMCGGSDGIKGKIAGGVSSTTTASVGRVAGRGVMEGDLGGESGRGGGVGSTYPSLRRYLRVTESFHQSSGISIGGNCVSIPTF